MTDYDALRNAENRAAAEYARLASRWPDAADARAAHRVALTAARAAADAAARARKRFEEAHLAKGGQHNVFKIISSLVPDLPADREATLAPLRDRVAATRGALMAARAEYSDIVERLARLDMPKLQQRLRPEFYPVVGSARTAAIALRATFDHSDVSIDLKNALRTAASPTATPSEFVRAIQNATRDADLYVGNVENVDALVRRLVAALSVLEDAETIFSEAFQIPPRQEFGFIAVTPK